jgi:Sulfotransferase domain
MTEVPRYFRGRDEDLLTLNICAGDGWPPLASFLGKVIPGVLFPHLNEMMPAAS